MLEILKRAEPSLRVLGVMQTGNDLGTAMLRWSDAGLAVRVVRGRKMRTTRTLFDEFAAAFQFPLYFGENKDAFDECIRDLEGFEPGSGIVVLIIEPEAVLADEDVTGLAWLMESLTAAAAERSRPIDRGEWWDRPALPFHVVLAGEQASSEVVGKRWKAAGADLSWLELSA